MKRPVREVARVAMHLQEGYTKVVIEKWEGRMANGGITVDIPTSDIPPHLRTIGSRFIIVSRPLTGVVKMIAEEIRNAKQFSIEEIKDDDRS